NRNPVGQPAGSAAMAIDATRISATAAQIGQGLGVLIEILARSMRWEIVLRGSIYCARCRDTIQIVIGRSAGDARASLLSDSIKAKSSKSRFGRCDLATKTWITTCANVTECR